MTFNQTYHNVHGNVYNVGHDLVLGQDSPPSDLLKAVRLLQRDLEVSSELSDTDKIAALETVAEVERELTNPEASKDHVLSSLDRLKGRLTAMSGAVASLTALAESVSAMSEWASKFFG